MVRFEKLIVPEKVYPYVDCTCATAVMNGCFGTVSDGVFTPGAGTYCVMQVERGDNAHSDAYRTVPGGHIRVADMTLVQGIGEVIVNITADNIATTTYAVDDALAANANGKLAVA